MFKSARWRSDKNKIKAVFKLQFHATQVSHLGGDALVISLVPADVGKPTLRLEKSTVQDGSCCWEKPVYETVKFIRDPKTGKIHERVYHFVLATAPTKVGVVGEVSIDFANYAVATKLSSVSLPLKNAKFEAVLHVSIQRMQDSLDQREVDEYENAKNNPQDRSLRSQLSHGNTDGSIKSTSTLDGSLDKTLHHVAELNGNRRESSGSDVTISSSESLSGLDTPREPGTKNNNIHEDRTSFLSSLGHPSVPEMPTNNVSTPMYEEIQRSQWEWLGGSAPEASTDDSSSSPRETLIRELSHEPSDIVIEKLKTDLVVLSRQAEVSELELQTLRKQIVKESKRGQDLSREVVSLKEERDALKDECDKLKASQKHVDEAKVKNKMEFEGGDPSALLEELREEINYEKDLNANLRLQLQKTQESNAELILAVRDLDEMLEQKNKETLKISTLSVKSENIETSRETKSKCGTDDDEEQRALEELVKEHSNGKEACILEKKLADLYSEMEVCKRDKDDLEMQMEQLALDYEILKQENHDISYKLEQSEVQEQLKMQYECSSSYDTFNELEHQIESLENDLTNQSKELENKSKEVSESLATIKDLETHIETLEEELENQAQGFEADLEDIMREKIEQEQRAIRAEDTLRKTRWHNANTAERLQDEVKRLSFQMASTFDANENVAKKALIEADKLNLQKTHLEGMLQKAREDRKSVGDNYESKLKEVSSQITLKISQLERMQSELDQQRKHAEQTQRLLSEEIVMHRTEIERLTVENNILSEQAEERESLRAEMEQLKESVMENEMLVIRGITETNELESMFASVKMEQEKSLKELSIMRSLKDEKEYIIGNLQLEMETLKAQCNELRHSLFEDELEKENMRRQVSQLMGDLSKKEDALRTIEKKLKDSNARATALEATEAISKNHMSDVVSRAPKEVANLKERIKLLESQIKLKETALETSTNSFLEKENDLHNKIKEFERRLEAISHNAMSFCGCKTQKVDKDPEGPTLNGKMTVEVRGTAENSSTKKCMPNESENGRSMLLINSNDGKFQEKGSAIITRDQGDLDELLNEVSLMRERNKSMECELKEMQERYSEISLKFAEVEGERQQLVMTLRNLKNAKKI